MSILKELLTDGEYEMTKSVLYEIRKTYGYDEYIFAKKMILVAAVVAGVDGFQFYKSFVNMVLEPYIKEYKNIPFSEHPYFARKFDSFGDCARYYGYFMKYIINSNYSEVERNVIERRNNFFKNKQKNDNRQ